MTSCLLIAGVAKAVTGSGDIALTLGALDLIGRPILRAIHAKVWGDIKSDDIDSLDSGAGI